MPSVTTIFLLATIQAAMCAVSPDPKDFFPKIQGNLTKIVWAHAVNSQAELESAFASDDVMMLEADVVIGKLNVTTNETNPDRPIMAHPPAKESDLSLEEFLNAAVKNGTKGIKLDFKTIEAFNMSRPILASVRNNLTFPVFLNADIMPGPLNATDLPVNETLFLKGAMETLPECTLSVGWTTRYGSKLNITEGRYTEEHVRTMIDALQESKVTQPVTYPVRAGLVANGVDSVKSLMKNSSFLSNVTLTIWSSEGDEVNAVALSKLIRDMGVDKVYVDVPKDLWKKLRVSAAPTVGSMLPVVFVSIFITLLASRML
ncbi:hypothetical protein KM043_002687 [Ampulex compressa]|nr:hypothetical protein KM043_002687 [Ampulex compressa]